MVKNLPTTAGEAGDTGLIPGLGRFPGVGNGNPLQYSCLENSMDRRAWWPAVRKVAKTWTQLSTHTHSYSDKYFHKNLFKPLLPFINV